MSDNERTIVIRVLKFDPQSAVSKPHFKEYQLKETPSMTLFIALNLIREHQDP
ncbi:fumarate reductase iron-sulfur subunit, partial [Helicobacter pylori]